MSASVAGPGAAYNGRKIGKVNRTFLNNTVVAAIGGNRRRERQAEAASASAAACEMQLDFKILQIGLVNFEFVN